MTVSLVVVSHSAKLAEGVVELAAQMTQGKVAIVAAGGPVMGRWVRRSSAFWPRLSRSPAPMARLFCWTWVARSWPPRWRWNSSRRVERIA